MGPLTPIIGLRLLALAAGLRHTARDRSTWPVFQRLRPQIRNQPSSGFAAMAGFARRGRNALGDRSAENHHGREAAGFSAAWPREESSLRTRIRSPSLYPLSYGARLRGWRMGLEPTTTWTTTRGST